MHKIIAAAAFVAALAGCGGEASADPYDTYLDNAPAGEPTLSREDAQTRALLGCGQRWAAGTVDAVLADAYDPEC
jgi:hypothetical protein